PTGKPHACGRLPVPTPAPRPAELPAPPGTTVAAALAVQPIAAGQHRAVRQDAQRAPPGACPIVRHQSGTARLAAATAECQRVPTGTPPGIPIPVSTAPCHQPSVPACQPGRPGSWDG